MSQPLSNLEIKVIRQVLGVSVTITHEGSARIDANALGDYRKNSIAYFFNKQPDGEIYIRRQIAADGYYSHGQKYIYVIHRDPRTGYNGFEDVMEAASWLKNYISRHGC